MADWVGPADVDLGNGEAGQASVAWTGEDPTPASAEKPGGLRLFCRTYPNPHPELEVQTVDFISAMTKCGPFLVGMTVE